MVDNPPGICNTPEIGFPTSDGDKFGLIETLKDNMSGGFDSGDVDGARVNFKKGWGFVRASSARPAPIMRFEADSEEGLEEIESILTNGLDIAKAGPGG